MIEYAAAVLLIMIGLYAVIGRKNIIKKIMGLAIISNGIHLFSISLGYRVGGIAPIMTGMDIESFALSAVDPLLQALILTSIVISFSTTAVALAMIVQAYKKTGSADSGGLRRLRG